MKNVLKFIGFLVLYFVLIYAPMCLGYLSPYAWFINPAISALITATPILWAAKRWRKFGAVGVYPLFWALVMIALGSFSYIEVIIPALVIPFAAEGVRAIVGYDKQLGANLGYAVASLFPVSTLVIMFTQPEMYYAGAVEEMGSVAYADAIASLSSPIMLVVLIVVTLIAGYVGAILAEKLFKKAAKFE